MSKIFPLLQSVRQRQPFLIDCFLLILIGSLYGVLRYPLLFNKYLDIDEAFQLFIAARHSLPELIDAFYSLGPQQFPLDYFLSFIWVHFTTDIYLLRFVPLLWGLISVIVIYFLGKWVWNSSFGAFWAFLVCISFFHLQYSVTFRPYSLIFLLSCVEMLCFIKALDQNKWMGPLVVSAVLYQTIYPFALCQTGVQFCFVWILRKEKRRPFLKAVLGSWLVFIGLFLIKGKEVLGSDVFSYDSKEALSFDVFWNLVKACGQDSTAPAIVLLMLVLAGVWWGYRTSHLKYFTLLMGFHLVVTLVTISISLYVSGLFFKPRHAIPLLLPYLGLAAISILKVCGTGRAVGKGILKMMVASLVLLACLLSCVVPLKKFNRDNFLISQALGKGIGFLKNSVGPQDQIVFSNPNFAATFVYYYDENAFFNLDGVKLHYGFNFFQMPEAATVSNGRYHNRMFTLCSIDKTAQTIDIEKLLGNRRKSDNLRGKVWLVHLPMNYFPQKNPFSQFEDRRGTPVPVAPGIFLLTGC